MNGETDGGTMSRGSMDQESMDHSNMAGSNMAMPTTASAYVPTAAASDQFEIRSSQLALQKSQNADVPGCTAR